MKRKRLVALLGAAVLVASAALLSGGASAGPTSPTPAAVHSYSVASVNETFVDTSRPTPPNGSYPGSPTRTLPTLVLYPKQPAGQHRDFPLIVFSHGFTANGPLYTGVLSPWVARGYVVAAPTFPLSSGAAPGGPTILDYVNQPGDVSFVISQMLHLDHTDGSPLEHLIDTNEIGVAGHSLGAITTLGVADDSCCQDHRIEAAVSIAGLELPFPNGTFFSGHESPLLLIHGTADRTLPYSSSQRLFTDARAPKFFLTLQGAPHTPFFGSWAPVITNTVVAFFDLYLKHDGGPHAILAAGSVPGVSSVQSVGRDADH